MRVAACPVAYQTVAHSIRHYDLKMVAASIQIGRDIHTVRPHNQRINFPSVDPDLGNVMDLPKIQVESQPRPQILLGDIDVERVVTMAGKITEVLRQAPISQRCRMKVFLPFFAIFIISHQTKIPIRPES